jgi:MoaA/NifB/PqqE/SkfB family radical SAM enzyme
MNIARYIKLGSRYLSHRFQKLHPYEVQALLLNACDQKCIFCSCPEVKVSQMSTDQWRSIIRSLGKLGTMRIKFQGGEPTLRKDFRELCAEAKDAGIITATVTNGINISSHPELLDHLDEVVVSLDSTRSEVNNRLRSNDQAYQKAVKAIDIALERGNRTFVSMSVGQDNLPDIESMLEFCEDRSVWMNAQALKFGRIFYNDKVRDIGLTPEQNRAMHKKLFEWKKQGRNLMFSAEAYKKATTWPDLSVLTVRSQGESRCVCGKDYIHIDPNGDVFPCTTFESSLKPKNIIKDGFEEALLHVQHHDCGDCWPAYLNERKHLFKLKPTALREMFKRD